MTTVFSTEGLTALVIDDDPSHVRLMEIIIRRIGCSCDAVTDPEAGLRQALTHPYDFIIIDIFMPGLDGFMLASRLREQGTIAPLIAVSAATLQGLSENIASAGFYAALQKPITPKELACVLKRCCTPARRHVLRRSYGMSCGDSAGPVY